MEMLRDTLDSPGSVDDIQGVEVRTQAEAEAIRFVGSPRIRINVSDIEPWARTATSLGLSCRTYVDGPRRGGVHGANCSVAQSWSAFVKTVERDASAAAVPAASCQLLSPSSCETQWNARLFVATGTRLI